MTYKNGTIAASGDEVICLSALTNKIHAGRVVDLDEEKGTGTLWTLTNSGCGRTHYAQKVEDMVRADEAFGALSTLRSTETKPVDASGEKA